jgi:hypothetical protein
MWIGYGRRINQAANHKGRRIRLGPLVAAILEQFAHRFVGATCDDLGAPGNFERVRFKHPCPSMIRLSRLGDTGVRQLHDALINDSRRLRRTSY